MKVIFSPELNFDFFDYGIKIPLLSSRVIKISHTIPNHFFLHYNFDSLDQKFLISESDVSKIHDEHFVAGLFHSKEKRESAFFQCYEIDIMPERYDEKDNRLGFDHLLKIILGQITLVHWGLMQLKTHPKIFYLGGGMHHAMYSQPRGFCLLHDGLIALHKILLSSENPLFKNFLIIDVDAHKGDGAPEILSHHPTLKKKIKTLSIHMGDAWPYSDLSQGERDILKKYPTRIFEKDAVYGEELMKVFTKEPFCLLNDVEIFHFAGEENEYVDKLNDGLTRLVKKGLEDWGHIDGALIISGSDPYEHDELPSTETLRLSLNEMDQRDCSIEKILDEYSIPRLYVMGGGYGEKSHEVYTQFLGHFVREDSPFGTKVGPGGV